MAKRWVDDGEQVQGLASPLLLNNGKQPREPPVWWTLHNGKVGSLKRSRHRSREFQITRRKNNLNEEFNKKSPPDLNCEDTKTWKSTCQSCSHSLEPTTCMCLDAENKMACGRRKSFLQSWCYFKEAIINHPTTANLAMFYKLWGEVEYFYLTVSVTNASSNAAVFPQYHSTS